MEQADLLCDEAIVSHIIFLVDINLTGSLDPRQLASHLQLAVCRILTRVHQLSENLPDFKWGFKFFDSRLSEFMSEKRVSQLLSTYEDGDKYAKKRFTSLGFSEIQRFASMVEHLIQAVNSISGSDSQVCDSKTVERQLSTILTDFQFPQFVLSPDKQRTQRNIGTVVLMSGAAFEKENGATFDKEKEAPDRTSNDSERADVRVSWVDTWLHLGHAGERSVSQLSQLKKKFRVGTYLPLSRLLHTPAALPLSLLPQGGCWTRGGDEGEGHNAAIWLPVSEESATPTNEARGPPRRLCNLRVQLSLPAHVGDELTGYSMRTRESGLATSPPCRLRALLKTQRMVLAGKLPLNQGVGEILASPQRSGPARSESGREQLVITGKLPLNQVRGLEELVLGLKQRRPESGAHAAGHLPKQLRKLRLNQVRKRLVLAGKLRVNQ
ncbi:hypothetical protein CYMTET_40425, partial [Cymbomonas tetramitiformis]